jgi:nucleoside-diphosphate-sugar epimerase
LKKALVTGASGFVGRSMVGRLHAEGWEVRVLGRHNDLNPLTIASSWHKQTLGPALTEFAPDAVFHLAGRTLSGTAEEYYTANVIPAAQLLDALEDLPNLPTIVLMGSAAEYGNVAEAALPVSEEHPCAPISDYGASKHAQTLMGLCRIRSGWPIIVARLFNPVGPGMPKHLALGSFASRLAAGASVLEVGNLDVRRDFISVDEAARIVFELAQIPEAVGKVINICSGRAFLLRELVEQMATFAGRQLFTRPVEDRIRSGEMTNFVGCTRRLGTFGLTPAAPDFTHLIPELLEAAM